MNHVQDCLSIKNDRESSFERCGAPVKLVQPCLSVSWRPCEAHASLFMCGKDLTKPC